jgi:hypothetical protein
MGLRGGFAGFKDRHVGVCLSLRSLDQNVGSPDQKKTAFKSLDQKACLFRSDLGCGDIL